MTELEESVYAVFGSVLGLGGAAEVTGRNFFDLGGDSLLALDVASQVEEKLGGVFPLEELFETGDIDAVVATVAGQLA